MLIAPQNLAESVRAVRRRVAAAAVQSGRSVDSVTIVAASKSQPSTVIEGAARAGIEHFGESYVQEALGKLTALAHLPLTWHFIGQIQANKTRTIAEHFAWVHGLDRLRLAQRLAAQRPFHAPPLNVCIQVNIAGEGSKAGAAPQDVPALAAAVAELPRLALRGLMCLPPAEQQLARQRHWFAHLRALFEELNAHGARLDTLSMGMSADLEAAVLEGATLVRIGTAIFGARPRAAVAPA
jgi:pyridoxal phosphate enzyme (YggS family)